MQQASVDSPTFATLSTHTAADQLRHFVNHGTTTNIPGVPRDSDTLLLKVPDHDVQVVPEGLKKGLTKIKRKEIAIISE